MLKRVSHKIQYYLNPTLEYDSLPNATYSELGSHICDCFTTVISGCTDPSAINYDSSANIDDSSCVYCNLNYNMNLAFFTILM